MGSRKGRKLKCIEEITTKRKNKVNYKINSIKESNMIGKITIMGGTITALYNNWSDNKKYKLVKFN